MAFGGSVERGLAYQLGALSLFISVAAIVTALGFQHLGGYHPCPLCLMQRYAYYVAIPTLFIALALTAGGYRGWGGVLFFLVALSYFANTGLGVYHAGAEWKYWPGPDTCGGDQGVAATAGDLMKDLESIKVVRCDEASWRMLGLSFAGWSAVISFLLMALTLRASFAVSDRDANSR